MLDSQTTVPTTVVLGADGVSPVIGYTRDERNLAVVAWFHYSPLTTLPVVTLRCFICQGMVPVADLHSPEVNVSRVNGDSEYGYEAYHAACCS